MAFTKEQYEWLEKEAERLGIPISALHRIIVDKGISAFENASESPKPPAD